MDKRRFTGEELAKSLHLDLTYEGWKEYLQTNPARKYTRSNSFFAKLWRRINPQKLFIIRFADGHGVIITSNDANEACIEAVPFILDPFYHRCKNPSYNKSCGDCRKVFDDVAAKLNNSGVAWLGWVRPDCNWVSHF